MIIRLLLFLVMVAATGAFAFVAYTSLAPRDAAVASAPVELPPEPVTTTILTAAGPVPAGTLLRAEDIQGKEVPADEKPAEALQDTPDMRARLLGGMVRQPLTPGQTLTEQMVLQANDRGFLAAILAPGYRAIAVGVDPATGNAGLIWPGDRVDLVLTQILEDQAGAPSRRVVGETVLQDVRVVAVDQKLTQGAQGDTAEGDRIARTVTLEVSPEDAPRVAVAERLGRLALVVRAAHEPMASREPGEPRPRMGGLLLANLPAVPANQPAPAPASAKPVWAGDVSPALKSPEIPAAPRAGGGSGGRRITVINGATTSETSF
ncbi:Flp pilus assembly protein CpaB (plasmid) [Geminicoccaceae bacterium 1502E]|nr:Flp pilus assembly protein CpaB [Geminicoccaceae bacterium 1502E]